MVSRVRFVIESICRQHSFFFEFRDVDMVGYCNMVWASLESKFWTFAYFLQLLFLLQFRYLSRSFFIFCQNKFFFGLSRSLAFAAGRISHRAVPCSTIKLPRLRKVLGELLVHIDVVFWSIFDHIHLKKPNAVCRLSCCIFNLVKESFIFFWLLVIRIVCTNSFQGIVLFRLFKRLRLQLIKIGGWLLVNLVARFIIENFTVSREL